MNGFISYAHADAKAYRTLKPHLAALKRGFGLALWTDHQITAGTVWEAEIDKAIAEAQVFVLMLSPAFIGSDYVYDTELPAIRKRCLAGDTLVLPVVVKRCLWEMVANNLQAVPTNDEGRVKPVTDWQPHDHGCERATRQMALAIERHFGQPPTRINWVAP
jgi:hypothetical protein